MSHEYNPHGARPEGYDLAISAIFIAFMLAVTVLVFIVLI
jgi:hypothetical protein